MKMILKFQIWVLIDVTEETQKKFWEIFPNNLQPNKQSQGERLDGNKCLCIVTYHNLVIQYYLNIIKIAVKNSKDSRKNYQIFRMFALVLLIFACDKILHIYPCCSLLGPHLNWWAHLDLPLPSICPKIKKYCDKWWHPCLMDTFLVYSLFGA